MVGSAVAPEIPIKATMPATSDGRSIVNSSEALVLDVYFENLYIGSMAQENADE